MNTRASGSVGEPFAGTRTQLRQCPTLAGDDRALITHQIECGRCLQRQREHYHKCHRCAYRGKAADHFIPHSVVLGRAEDNGLPTGFIDIPRDG